MLAYMSLMILPFLVLVSGFHDVLSYRIPNILSLLLIAGFVVFAIAAGLSPIEIGMHFGWGLGVLIFTFSCFSFGLMGGGDAKLISAIALWIGGSVDMLFYMVYMTLFGGALSVFILYLRSVPVLPLFLTRFQWIASLHAGGTRHTRSVPYAIAIALGLMTSLPSLGIFERAVNLSS